MKSKMCLWISVLLIVLSNSLVSQTILPPPDSLEVAQQCDTIFLNWRVPQQSTYELMGYNVFLEDSLLVLTTDTTYQIQKQGYGSVTFNITSVYDAGESLPASIDAELVIYAPARNLAYNNYECKFYWDPPIGNYPYWSNWVDKSLQWCDNFNDDEIGTNGEVEFEIAALWGPDQLEQFNDGKLYLTRVDFFPTEITASYIIKVWESNYANEPDEEIHNQAVTNFTVNQWNSITLIDSLLINTNKYLWVGYQLNTPTGYPAGVDNGPAIDGFGNMINFGGWQTLLQINPGLDCNWNIKAGFRYLEEVTLYYDIYGYWECFNPYEHWRKLNDAPIYDTSYWYACVNPIDDFFDSCFVQVTYCDIAVNSDTAICEICWFSNSDPIKDENVTRFSVSNSYGNWNIHSDHDLIMLAVYDLAGKALYVENSGFNDLKIDYGEFAPGLYIIEGITAKERFVRKIYK